MATYGLLGEHLGHSYSPQIHALLGSVPYTLFEKSPEEVDDFIRNGAWDGINVTIPYKKRAAALADERSPRVEALGAANTLVRRPDGTIYAENTDVMGFEKLLEQFCEEQLGTTPIEAFSGKQAMVLGTGGASTAIAYVLEKIVGMKVRFLSHADLDLYQNFDARLLLHAEDTALLVNTTPVGMSPNCPKSPIKHWLLGPEPHSMNRLMGVIDIIYNPRITGLCYNAQSKDIPCASGLPMLVWQAVYASELFQGTSIDAAVARQAIDTIGKRMQNIALIGMPGCGKSTTGRILARMLSRPFVDLDDAFTLRYGRTPAEVIQQEGEWPFRQLECEVLREYGAKSGLVIACGGGVVRNHQNGYALLNQNSSIVFLDRPLEELSTEGRPLSQREGIEALYRQRIRDYRSWADIIVASTGSAKGDAEAIISALGL